MFEFLKKNKISNGVKHEDLIKQIENIEVPEIEIQSHKQRLKMALLTRLRQGYGGQARTKLNARAGTP